MKFNICILPSGIKFKAYSGTSVLQSALDAGYHLVHGCKDGSCGNCKARIASGRVNPFEASTGITESEINDGYILTCCVSPASDLNLEVTYYSELDGINSTIQPCKVEMITFPVAGIAVLFLKLAPNSKLQYLSGQYIDLIIQGSRRSYSIANSISVYDGIELHIKNIPNGLFSGYIFNKLKSNQLLHFEGPLGTYFIRDTGCPIIFLAGGTGFAPVKAMIEDLLYRKIKRQIYIYWGTISSGLFYSNLPEEWQKEHEYIKYIPVVSGEDPEWDGRTGLVHQAVLEDIKELVSYDVYACGAPEMINAARIDFITNGLLAENFYSDIFSSSN